MDEPFMDARKLKTLYQQQSKEFASQFLFCSLDGWMFTHLYLAQSWWYAHAIVRDIATLPWLLDLYYTQSSELAGLLQSFGWEVSLEPLKELYLSQSLQLSGLLAPEGFGWLEQMHVWQLTQAQNMLQRHSQGGKMCQELAEEQRLQMGAFLREHGAALDATKPWA